MYQATYELLSGMGRLEAESLSRASPAPNPAPTGARGSRMTPVSGPSAARHTAQPVLAAAPPPPAAAPVPAVAAKPIAAPAPAPSPQSQAQNEAVMQQVRSLMAPRDDFWKTGQQ
jgi:hypothetical protein